MLSTPEKRPQTLLAAMRHFTPEVAQAFVASIKWPDGPACPTCGSVNIGKIASRARFQCREKGCRKQFSLTTGTIMEGTHLRLDQWIAGVWMLVNCRNGVSSCEIARTIGCKQQSAWHLLHRARHILQDENGDQVVGECEADATHVGGLFKFMHHARREKARRRGNKGKTIVHAIKDRGTGRVRAEVIDSESTEMVMDTILENVQEGSTVYTDEGRAYCWVGQVYDHGTVNHDYEYVNGKAHTNGCENFFNCLRRACKGTYIKPMPEHLGAYVDEAVFRFNVRELNEWARFEKAMRRIVGKRLTYATLTDGAKR